MKKNKKELQSDINSIKSKIEEINCIDGTIKLRQILTNPQRYYRW